MKGKKPQNSFINKYIKLKKNSTCTFTQVLAIIVIRICPHIKMVLKFVVVLIGSYLSAQDGEELLPSLD